jgi:hypothetical protein
MNAIDKYRSMRDEKNKLILNSQKNLQEFENILMEAMRDSNKARISYAEAKIDLCEEDIEKYEKEIQNLHEKI